MTVSGVQVGQAVYGLTTTQQNSNRLAETASSNTTTSDSVDISGAAREMARVFSGAGGTVRVEDIEAETKAALGVFQKDLESLFAQNDIDTSQEINISTDRNGKVIVTNDHPDKEKIEQIFENDDDLANRYKGISNNIALLKAAEEASAFQKEYLINPQAAVAKYSYLFDENRNNTPTLSINGDRFNFEFKA